MNQFWKRGLSWRWCDHNPRSGSGSETFRFFSFAHMMLWRTTGRRCWSWSRLYRCSTPEKMVVILSTLVVHLLCLHVGGSLAASANLDVKRERPHVNHYDIIGLCPADGGKKEVPSSLIIASWSHEVSQQHCQCCVMDVDKRSIRLYHCISHGVLS